MIETDNITRNIDIPDKFASESKVWIYQCNRKLTEGECLEINMTLKNFVSLWKSHGNPVKGFGSVLFHQFLLVMADESTTGVSGCSTDSSVRLMKDIESKYGISLFDRLTLAFLINDDIVTIPLANFQQAIKDGMVNEETLYFNNTILTKEALENEWLIPIRKSWLAQKIKN